MQRTDALRVSLEDFCPGNNAQAEHRTRMLDLLEAGDRALCATHFDPGHFTASGLVVSPKRDALLMILHGKLGLWLQPGGHVEPGDSHLLAAARREVAEEVGMVATDLVAHDTICDVDIHAIPGRPGQPAHKHFDVRYLLLARSAELKPSDEVLAVRWVPWASIAELETDSSVRRVSLRLRQQLGSVA